MNLIQISSSDPSADPSVAEEYCRPLEHGDIVEFAHVPFDIPSDDLRFLLSAKQENTRLHKNISYRPGQDIVRGLSRQDAEEMRGVMRRFSAAATAFLGSFLTPYAGEWQLDYASFRPIEESGRELPLHKRNDLLHVDAFPSRPTWGGRILRFFTNINPTELRVWEVGERFEQVASAYADNAGLAEIAARGDSPMGRLRRRSRRFLSKAGLPLPDRSAYDEFMLRFHDFLKENEQYQRHSEKTRIEFRPNTSWIVYTDCVPHSVLSGRFALEQTFIVPFEVLVDKDVAPASVLERIAGCSLR